MKRVSEQNKFFAILNLIRALIVFAILAGEVSAAVITVATDRNPVNVDESFRIIFSASETPDDNPDFSPLEQNFQILNQSSSTSSSWINGKSSKTMQWTITVMAKQTGNLAIPPVNFGGDISEAASVVITENSSNQDVKTVDDLFIDVEATPGNPYVQSQIIYTLKLYTRLDIAQARLNEPELADAVIEKLGDDSSYHTQVDGVNYSVTERKYAIFPQKSGKLTIKPLVLTAEVLTSGRPSFSGFFSQQFTKTKRVESKAITIDVQPVSAEFSGKHWLPAEELDLQQSWSGDMNKMKVGEPLTRTISLQAKGTTVGQLPELNSAKIDDKVKAYPDQPVLKEQKKADGIVASREEKIALIPSKPGEYTLPAIEIPWFNTRTKKIELAKLPAIKISAEGIAEEALDGKQTKQEPVNEAQTAQIPQWQAAQSNFWVWVSALLLFGWVTTLIYFLTRHPVAKRVKKSKKKPNATQQDSDLKTYIGNLKKACSENNAEVSKENLILWGKHKFNVNSLGAIARLCDNQLGEEIMRLSEALYSKRSMDWQGDTLFQAFVNNNAAGARNQKPGQDSALEPLYRL